MIINKITEHNKEEFEEHILNNICNYFSFIHQVQSNFDNSEFWMGKREDAIIGGMFRNQSSIRIFGSKETVDLCFQELGSFPKYLSLPYQYRDISDNYIEAFEKSFKMHRLYMDKQPIQLKGQYTIKHLEREDLAKALDIFRKVESVDQWSMEPEQLPYNSENIWYGIYQDDKLASACWNQIYAYAGHIAFIGTLPEYQKRGMGAELIKYAISQNFLKNNISIIHVSDENSGAYELYKKIGYTHHFSLYTIIDPIQKT